MKQVKINFKKMRPDAVTPTKAHETDTGFDLTILDGKQIADNIYRYDTGIAVQPQEGYYTEVYPRSSFSKTGYVLLNSVGIIDHSYRGSILVTLMKVNPSCPDLPLPYKGFQLVVRKLILSTLQEVDELDETARGKGGFGSSG